MVKGEAGLPHMVWCLKSADTAVLNSRTVNFIKRCLKRTESWMLDTSDLHMYCTS